MISILDFCILIPLTPPKRTWVILYENVDRYYICVCVYVGIYAFVVIIMTTKELGNCLFRICLLAHARLNRWVIFLKSQRKTLTLVHFANCISLFKLKIKITLVIWFNGISILDGYSMPNSVIHTHTHIYIYIYIYIYRAWKQIMKSFLKLLF